MRNSELNSNTVIDCSNGSHSEYLAQDLGTHPDVFRVIGIFGFLEEWWHDGVENVFD